MVLDMLDILGVHPGLFFIGTELLLSMRAPKKFLRQQLRPADTYEQSKDADTLVSAAITRIVGLLHLQIQAGRFC